jgi:phospholipid/cholesterol/gamma-HCH transport system ATP-binding protein
MTIEFQNITKSFGQRTILDDISFNINKGEIIFILGRSGMGKSVTLKLIMGLYPPDNGKITVDGTEVLSGNYKSLRDLRKKCGMVFQHPALFDSMTIYENVSFGIRNESEKVKLQRVKECLTLVHLESDILNKRPQQLSYGMQKRVSLARTIAYSPDYILFDEPTTGLDPITTTAINELIQELSQKLNVTSVVVSHDMGCALGIADRIIIIDETKIIEQGNIEQIKKSRIPLVTSFLAEVIS